MGSSDPFRVLEGTYRVRCLYAVVYQRSSASPNPLDLHFLEVPEERVQRLSVLAVLGYALTLTNSVIGISISCEAGKLMGPAEYSLRLLAAVALFLGGIWVCALSHSIADQFWRVTTYGDVLLVHLLVQGLRSTHRPPK